MIRFNFSIFAYVILVAGFSLLAAETNLMPEGEVIDKGTTEGGIQNSEFRIKNSEEKLSMEDIVGVWEWISRVEKGDANTIRLRKYRNEEFPKELKGIRSLRLTIDNNGNILLEKYMSNDSYRIYQGSYEAKNNSIVISYLFEDEKISGYLTKNRYGLLEINYESILTNTLRKMGTAIRRRGVEDKYDFKDLYKKTVLGSNFNTYILKDWKRKKTVLPYIGKWKLFSSVSKPEEGMRGTLDIKSDGTADFELINADNIDRLDNLQCRFIVGKIELLLENSVFATFEGSQSTIERLQFTSTNKKLLGRKIESEKIELTEADKEELKELVMEYLSKVWEKDMDALVEMHYFEDDEHLARYKEYVERVFEDMKPDSPGYPSDENLRIVDVFEEFDYFVALTLQKVSDDWIILDIPVKNVAGKLKINMVTQDYLDQVLGIKLDSGVDFEKQRKDIIAKIWLKMEGEKLEKAYQSIINYLKRTLIAEKYARKNGIGLMSGFTEEQIQKRLKNVEALTPAEMKQEMLDGNNPLDSRYKNKKGSKTSEEVRVKSEELRNPPAAETDLMPDGEGIDKGTTEGGIQNSELKIKKEEDRIEGEESKEVCRDESGLGQKLGIWPPFAPPYSAEKLTGQVVTADGEAVSGGQIAVATTRMTVYIKNGCVMFEGYGSSKNKVVETDEDGMFDLGDIPDVTYAVVACHESGWAIVEDVDYQKNKTIELRPWGGVKGKLANYKEIESTHIVLKGLPGSFSMKHSIDFSYHTDTQTDGVFEINKLPEGMYEVGYYTRISYSGGGTNTCRTPVRVKSGQISDMTLGGDGRTVKGKFVTPEGYKGKMYFGEGIRSLHTDRPEEPRPDNYQEMSSKEKNEWWEKWRFTDSYYKWQNSWINENWRQYAFRIKKDGTFAIKDVLPGKYGFYVEFEDDLFGPGRGEELGGYYKNIEIPEAADGSDEPYDCGELEIEVRNTYHIGDDAPLFEYKTLAGETVRLADLKGKVVLLDLWYSNMTRNRPKIQAAYDKYKDDPRLVILGICLDKNRKEMVDYLAKNPTDWPQIYDKQKKILTDYGEYAPVLVLIGADGKLLSRWLELRGDRKLQPLLDETMGRLKPENKPKEKRAVYDVELQFLSIDMEKVGIDFSKIEANGWTIDDIQADFIKEAVKAAENSLSIIVPEFEAVESEQNDFSDSEGIVTNNDKLEIDKLLVTLDEAENNRISLAFELEYAHESGKFADADKTLSMMSVQSFSNTIRIPEGKRVIMPLGGKMDIQYYVMVKADVKTKYKGSSIKDEKKEIKNSELRIKKEEDGREAIGNRESAIGEGIDDGRAESVDLDTEKAGKVIRGEVNNWGFGKVKEIICSADVVDGLTYIELDSGKVYTDKEAENGVEPENYDVSKSNIIVTVDKDGNYKLTTKDMAFVHAANREWVTSSVSEVVNNNELNNSQAIWTSNKGNKDQLPETWYFKTWAGENYGIVQISEYIEKANGFKLQYKLVDKTVKIRPKRCLVVFSGIELDEAAIVKDFFDKNGLKLEIVSRKGTKGYTLVTHDGFAWTKDDEFRELRKGVKLVGSLYSLWYKEGWPRITNNTFESAYPIDTDRLEYIEDTNVESKSEGNRIKAKVGVFVSLYSAKGPSWWQGSEIGFFHARIAEMFNDPQEYDLYALVDPGTENDPAIKEIMAEIGFPGNKCLNAASVEDLQKVDVMVSGNWHVNITWEILDAITEAVGRGVHLVNYEHFGLIRPAYATGEEATQATWASHMNAVIRSNPEEVEKYKDRITLLFGLKRPQFVWHLSNVKWKLKKNHPIFDYLNKDDMIVSAGINGLVGYNEGEKTFELVDDEITDKWNGRKVSRNELDVFSVHRYSNGLVVNLPLLGDLPSYGMRDQFHCVRHCVDWVAGQRAEESEEVRVKSEEYTKEAEGSRQKAVGNDTASPKVIDNATTEGAIKNSELRIKKEKDLKEGIGNRQLAIGEGIDDGRAENIYRSGLDDAGLAEVAPPPPADEDNDSDFLAVFEVVCLPDVPLERTYIELDTGYHYPGASKHGILHPFETKGANIITEVQTADKFHFFTRDAVFVPVANEKWLTMSLEELLSYKELDNDKAESISSTCTKEDTPKTWIFKTNKNNVGIVHLVGFCDKTKGVIYRFKIAKDIFEGQIEQFKQELLNAKDDNSFTIYKLTSIRYPEIAKTWRELALTDKPWISLFSAWKWQRICNQTEQPEEIPDEILKKLALTDHDGSWEISEEIAKQAYQMIPDILDSELLKMDPDRYMILRLRMIRELGWDMAKETDLDIMRQLTEDETLVDLRRVNLLVITIARNFNYWYGVNIGTLGATPIASPYMLPENYIGIDVRLHKTKIPENSEELLMLVREILEWDQEHSGIEIVISKKEEMEVRKAITWRPQTMIEKYRSDKKREEEIKNSELKIKKEEDEREGDTNKRMIELPGIGKIPVYASNDPNDMHSKLRQAIADTGEIDEDTSILKAIGAWSLSYEDWDNNIYIGGPIEWSSYHNNWYGYYYDRDEYEQYRNRLYDPEFSGKRVRASYTIEWDKKD